MHRAPSLRDLRRNRPDNVVILPTAAPRQIHQQWNKETRAAKRSLCAAHPWPGERLFPGQREAIKRAEAVNSAKQTPALRIAFAILASLDAETRKAVAGRLAVEALSGVPEAKQAAAIADCAALTIGERLDLDFAFKWIAGRAENGETAT
jgi:hypothetical protein